MTTPGGVPNLPMGALTLDTLATKLQDMSGTAMKNRAVERFPSIFDSSTGLSPASDITPFGILTRIWAEVNSLIANADPADVQGPEDLPPLVLEFIEGLPVVGQFVGLLEAILGTYDGDDTTLLTIQTIFAPIGKLMQVIGGGGGGVPIGAISNQQPNLAIAPTFAAGSIEDNPYWTVDLTSSRTADGTGSAKVTADGTTKALRSGRTHSDTYPVSAGQTFSDSIFVSQEGYSGSGPAVLLQVVPFIGSVPGEPVALTTTSPGTGSNPDVLVPATYTPAGADLAWPGFELAGNYVVPEGVTGVQTRYVVTENALAGTFRFDDAYAKQSGLLSPESVDGLPASLQDLATRGQLLLDTIFKSLTGSDALGNTFDDLFNALLNIPSDNVNGVNGPANIGDSLLDFLDHLVGGMVGTPGTGASNADVFNIAKLISSYASQGAGAWEVLGYRNNTPVDGGLLPSSESNYNLTVVNTTLDATQAASLIGVIRVQRSAPLGVVSWLGYGTVGLSAFYVNVWKINATTGEWTLAHHSPDIKANLVAGGSADWNFYNLATPLARVQGEDYAYELVPVGGTHHVRGFNPTDPIPDHPSAQIVNVAATRNNTSSPNTPPSSIAKASVVRSNNVPWIETAIDTGGAADQHDPVTIYLTGSESVPIPNWAGFIEAIPLGAGGGGHQGGFLTFGDGGKAGRFNPTTWEFGVDFDETATSVVFTCGSGGTAGNAGGPSTFTIPGHSVTAEGGAGGETARLIKTNGEGPGAFVYNDENYVGGGTQSTSGAAGAAPGGGGAGGNNITFQDGGMGGGGAGWIRFRQAPRVIEDAGDTTPPTPPGLSLGTVTPSTLTVTAVGATD